MLAGFPLSPFLRHGEREKRHPSAGSGSFCSPSCSFGSNLSHPLNSNSELPIGIFDTGVGGLTEARQLRRVLPQEALIYLEDTARVPSLTKAPSTVLLFASQYTSLLLLQ